MNDTLCRMRGTDHTPLRCVALTGKVIGQSVACGIYEWRPNPCHELQAGSDACDSARGCATGSVRCPTPCTDQVAGTGRPPHAALEFLQREIGLHVAHAW